MDSPSPTSSSDHQQHRQEPELGSSPPSESDFDLRFQYRNSEAVHQQCLAEAYTLHQKVRESALRLLEVEARKYELAIRQKELDEQAEAIRVAQVEAEQRLKALELDEKRKAIPSVPKAPTPPAQATMPAVPPSASISRPKSPVLPPAQKPQAAATPAVPSVKQEVPATKPPTVQPPQIQSISALTGTQATPAPASVKAATTQPEVNNIPVIGVHPDAERYVAIHKKLKLLRKFVDDGGKGNPAFKKAAGEMRRGIRQSVGQLVATGVPQVNKDKIAKIRAILLQALKETPSPPVDPAEVVAEARQPVEGAANNGQLPALFIYLLNHFSKAIIAQLIDESGVRVETAEPIGLVAVSVFADLEFLWRGSSLIDILMAKYRVVCPVLFGFRGNEKTNEGRARVGWWKIDGNWISDQVHNTRMTGLGAGYASICLRRFGTVRKHPWPTSHYWISLASILATPASEVSSTQYLVLKAMIDRYVDQFCKFYGNAAIAALQVALVHFPARSPEQNAATRSLAVLADKIKIDKGIDLIGHALMA